MAQMTPQQIAVAAAKRRATQAANRANGIPTVRQQRAAARAAKAAAAGQPFVPPTSRPRVSRVGRKGGPTFAAPKPDPRNALLVALVAFEDAFAVALKGHVTPEARKSYDRYLKLKALALGVTTTLEAKTEAFSALRASLIEAIKLSF